MKLVHVSFQVQYTDLVEEVLARQGLRAWARYGRVAGRDCDGRHEGSQAFPGNLTVIQAQVGMRGLAGFVVEPAQNAGTGLRVVRRVPLLRRMARSRNAVAAGELSLLVAEEEA